MNDLSGTAEVVESKEPRPLIHFCRNIALFVIPPIVLVFPAMVILMVSGEHFYDVDRVLAQLNKHDVLVGYAYNEQHYAYIKFQRLHSLPRQSVVALGSSRVLGFRARMFRNPLSFYNAGYSVVSLRDIREFIEALPEEKTPDILLIGLDQWMFHPDWEATMGGKARQQWTSNTSSSFGAAIETIPKIYKDFARSKFSLAALLAQGPGPLRIGMNSSLHKTGFRNDGSYEYGSHVEDLISHSPSLRDRDFSDTLRRIDTGGHRFEWSDDISETAVAEINRVLEECRERGIHVVAFLPPFADAVYHQMVNSKRYEYMHKIVPAIQHEFEKHDAELYEFSSLSSCGSSDGEAIDGFHGSDVSYLRLLIKMLERDSRLNSYVDLNQLAAELGQRRNSYVVYSDDRVSRN